MELNQLKKRFAGKSEKYVPGLKIIRF